MELGKAIPHRATGAAAIVSALTPTGPIVLDSVKLHLSAVGGAVEDFTVTINSVTDPAYDVLLFSQAMLAVQDIFWQPERPIAIVNSDVVDFYFKNANGRTYGLEVLYRKER